MAEKSTKTVSDNGMKITETWEDGSSKTYSNPNYNPEPNWGVSKGTPKATPKATAKATPTPTAAPKMPIPASRPKGSQAGHAITDSKNHTRTVK